MRDARESGPAAVAFALKVDEEVGVTLVITSVDVVSIFVPRTTVRF